MFKIFLLLCSLTCVLCQDCQTQLTTCLTNAQQQHEAKMADMKSKFEACFTSNNCTVPTFNLSQNATPTNANVTDAIAKAKDCAKQAATVIEGCVSTNTNTTFTFPAMNAEGEHHGFEGHPGFNWKGGKRGEHGDFFGNVCNGNNDGVKAVQQCLQGLKGNSTHMKKGQGKHHMKNPFCEVRDNCTRNLTTECQGQLKAIKAALCTCSRSNTTVQSFATCMGINITAGFNSAKHRRHQRNAHHGGNQGGPAHSQSHFRQHNSAFGGQHNMGFDLCSDPCDQQTENGNQHSRGRQGFNNRGGNSQWRRGSNQGDFNQGGNNQWGRGFNHGDFNQGGNNQWGRGFSHGDFNQGGNSGRGSNRGDYNRGGYNRGDNSDRREGHENGGSDSFDFHHGN